MIFSYDVWEDVEIIEKEVIQNSEEDNSDYIDGCNLVIRDEDATSDENLPVAEGGIA